MTSRRVYARILGGSSAGPTLSECARAADELVDGALVTLGSEEPTLQRWLDGDPAIANLLRVNTTAMHALIIADARRGYDLERTMKRMDTLVYRALCAVALETAMHERRGSPI